MPVLKSGDPKLFSDYRPILLLPSVSKVIERLVYNRLYKFISKHNLLYSKQYGFRRNHSTYMAAISLVDKISQGLDNKLTTAGIFLDLSKAFDTIDHNILMNKLFAYGVRGVAYDWFKSYLHDRCNYVQFNNSSSHYSLCNIGVPQGSILGPLLFMLYINDVYKSSQKFDFILFADDTTVLLQNSNLSDTLGDVTNEFSKVSEWMRSNRLSLNILKTKLVIFDNKTKDTSNANVLLNGQQITASNQANFLGITIDRKLDWKEHISAVSKKIARLNGVINRLKPFLPKNILLTLYNALILPHLSYSLLLWGNTHATFLNNLHKIQKRAVRNICNVPYRASSAPLFTNLKILTIRGLFNYQLGIFVYKSQCHLLPSSFENFYTHNSCFHNYNTRSKNCLSQPLTRTYLAHSQLRSTGVNFWNSLSQDIRSSPSIHIFKKKLKKFLLNNNSV